MQVVSIEISGRNADTLRARGVIVDGMERIKFRVVGGGTTLQVRSDRAIGEAGRDMALLAHHNAQLRRMAEIEMRHR
jgi:hypothetical protein